MHPGIRILEEVVKLAEGELELLESEDAEGLTESAQKRGELLKEAWASKNGCDDAHFTDLLMSIQELQRRLNTLAEEKYAETRTILGNQKKSRNAILGYCKTGVGYGRGPHKIFAKFS